MVTASITRTEWIRAVIFAVLVMVLTVIPYQIGYSNETPEQQFSGFVLGADDGHSYIAKMRRSLDGMVNFYLFYTTEPHDAAPLVYMSYILPGQAVRPFLSVDTPDLYNKLVNVYHGMRLVFGMLLILTMYGLIALFIEAPAARLLALIVATLGGGLGLLLLRFEATPPEWFIPESFTFLILLTLPHLALARAAILGGFILLMRSERYAPMSILAGILWLITGMYVPFYLAVIYAVLGIWGILLWIKNRAFPMNLFVRAAIAGGITLPLFGYYLWVFDVNPVMAQWSAQNNLPSPPIHHYLLAYAPYLVAGMFAVRWAWRSSDDRYSLLLAWALVGLALVYLPINVQRRLAEGVIVPLAILAVIGIWQENASSWKQTVLILTTLPTMLFLLLGTTLALRNAPPDLYTSTDVIEALGWLDDNAIEQERGAVVLSRFAVGNRVPAYTGLRPYVGHGPETLNSGEKKANAEAFFSGEIQERELITENDIDYVFFDDGDIVPEWMAVEFTEIYRENGIVIFAVQ